MEIVFTSSHPLPVTAIRERAKKRVPAIAMGTVYRILKELVAYQRVAEICQRGRPRLYAPVVRIEGSLRCRLCGETSPVPMRALEEARRCMEAETRYLILGTGGAWEGICPACRSAGGDGS